MYKICSKGCDIKCYDNITVDCNNKHCFILYNIMNYDQLRNVYTT